MAEPVERVRQSPTSVAESPNASSIRVLLVEDTVFQLVALQSICTSIGYQVQTATSGEEVLALVADRDAATPPWDLVLCDVMLKEGGLTGVDVLLHLRATYGSQLSIVMVSSNEQSAVVEGDEEVQ